MEDTQLNKSDLIHRKQDLKQMHKQDDKMQFMPIFPYDGHLDFEVFIIELLPGCTHLSPSHQAGVIEHVIVAKGEIEILINDIWQPVKQHEGLRFNADKPHGYRNLLSTAAVFHDMIHYKKII